MKRKLTQLLGLTILLVIFASTAMGQGTTSSAMHGIIKDSKGETLPSATIVLTHMPTGTKYSTITRDDGRYNFPNVKSGSPYTLAISYTGYRDFAEENISLALGEDIEMNITLQEVSTVLSEVVVYAKQDKTFNVNNVGASTNVNQKQLAYLPTISRSLSDFSRLTPQANTSSSGVSFSGTNNRYNSFQIDGTMNNDVFGLGGSGSNAGSNGGSAGTAPISLDAIQELQVVIAPFDVRQSGFTGGGINAVTKSGTNEFHGSIYGMGNNEGMMGYTNGKIADANKKHRTLLGDQRDYTGGVTLGGPIVKNKLFFFASYEHTFQSYPVQDGLTAAPKISQATAARIMNNLTRISGGYNGGGYGAVAVDTKADKYLGRIDWNINDNHKLTLRYNYVDASKMNFSRSYSNVLRFSDNGFNYYSKAHSVVAELNSRFSSKISNEFRTSYNRIRDYRDIMGQAFPYIRVDISGSDYAEMGTERYSMANKLNQDIFTLEDNLNLYLGKHTLTFGTHNEFFKMYNVYIRENYGSYRYGSVEAFESIGTMSEMLPTEYNYSFSNPAVTGSNNWGPTFKAMQLGFYAQDEWAVSKQFKLSLGLRMDIPIFLDKPSENTTFNATSIAQEYDVKTNQMPKSTPLISPRVGFNWDVTGNRSTQVRGGAGIFTGRVPFVWIANSFSNSGVEYVRSRYTGSSFPAGFKFEANPYNQPVGAAVTTTEIDVATKNFKFPQVLRLNLAIDQKLPGGIKATVEGIYTKKINDVLYKNINIAENGTYLNNFDDKRPRYGASIDKNYTSVILLDNTSKGYSYSLTGKLEKSFNFGLNLMAAYTYGQSKDVNSGTSSQAYSNWSYNEQWRGSNNPELSYSDFDLRHRIIGSVMYNVKYGENFGTAISIFYNGQTGGNYSVCYNGDINGDGVYGNDVIFVPTDAQVDQMTFKPIVSGTKTITPAEQQANLKAFLAAYPDLKNMRGKYAERNSLHTPFENHIDLRVAQDFYIYIGSRKTTLQFTVDVMNVANMLNKDWGVSYNPGYSYTPIKVESVAADGTPTFSFDNSAQNPMYSFEDIYSRWRAQFGVRFIF